jgi:prepilin signal peptidase PulO-like enzyme (type II secretory pathway)
LIPLFSFLLLGQKCRGCKQPISWRYFTVELITGLLFAALVLFFRNNPANAVAFCAFAAVMVPVFGIDWERFEIPDSLNILATLIPLVRDGYGIATHEPGFELLWGWMPRSVFGALLGMAIFGGVRIIGWLWKGVEAMGLGDVLLARGMGGMLAFVVPLGYSPARLMPVWVLAACLSGIVIGYPLTESRKRQNALRLKKQQEVTGEAANVSVEEDEDASFEREGTFMEQLAAVGWCFVLGDVWNYLYLTFVNPKEKERQAQEALQDDWKPLPSAVPFGPFMIVGFFVAMFVGEKLVSAYINYALPPIKETSVQLQAAPGTTARAVSSKASKNEPFLLKKSRWEC